MSAALALKGSAGGLLLPDFVPEYWLYVDFETYFDADFTLRKLTTSDYIRDPRFETIGVGIFDGEQEVWMEHEEFVEWAKTVPWEKTAVVAHHTHFDGFILSHHYNIRPAFLCCTMSMARTYGIDGGVSLENLGEKFEVGIKGNEVENARGKRRKDFTQEEWLRYGAYCLQDVRICRGVFDKMIAGSDDEPPFPEAELWAIDAIVRMFTEPKLFVDEPLLTQYLADERLKKADLLERVNRDKSLVLSNEKFAKELMALGVEPPTKRGKNGTIFAFAKTDIGMQELLEHEEDEVRWLAEARVAVKSTINETRTERFLRMGKGARPIPAYIKYWGAHTGRTAAGDKTNFQNLERTNKRNPKKGTLKKALLAPFGHKIVAVDSGAIEARLTAWVAGHESLLEAFRQRRDVYSEFASQIYQRKVDRKANPEDEIPGQVGKVGILGFGFGQGVKTAAQNFLKGVQGAPPITFTEVEAEIIGVDVNKFWQNESKIKQAQEIISRLPFEKLVVHCAVTDKIVRKWRDLNEPIVELWSTMEEVLEVMLEDDANYSFGPNGCMRAVRHGIVLPNGLTLRYPGLMYQEEESLAGPEGYSYLGQYGKLRKHTYGGAMTENVVQALARLIVFEQMNHVRAVTGFVPSLFAHDEWSWIVPDGTAPWLLNVAKDTMKTPPRWAEGLPLSNEGGFHQSYGYAKS
jgi:hypothetical protein